MFRQLKEDIACVRERDPAARSVLEVLLLYPGLKAIRMHRRANWCYRHRLFFWHAGFPSAPRIKRGLKSTRPQKSAADFLSTMARAWSSVKRRRLGTT